MYLPQMIYTYSLPAHVDPLALRSGSAIVIDVLRATTTICTALNNGCRFVIPCLSIEDAINTAAEVTPRPLLGGERGGLPIAGFDYGNSPAEYSIENVDGHSLVFTTTNGTKAMGVCAHAQSTMLASFANLTAVRNQCQIMLDQGQDLHIICAGTNGEVTEEDSLLAGAIASTCASSESIVCPTTTAAVKQWNRIENHETDIFSVLLHSNGGRNLQSVGLESDIRLASAVDTANVLPVLDQQLNRVTA